MKIKIGKYTWSSKKCVPLQIIKYGLLAGSVYVLMLLVYFTLVPYSTIG